ncbi:MAG: restriction endonuclease subunit S [Burkholderiales bacterium]
MWAAKTLGEVLEKTETVNPAQSPSTEFDYIDVSSVSNSTFEIEETQRLKGKDAPSRARKLVRTNDIIFATIRPTLQRIAVVPAHLDRQVCSTGYFVLRPKQGIDHRFVFYSLFTEDFIGQMESLQKGASYPAVTDGDVRAQKIPVPPLAEQLRIVGLLDEAFECIATAKTNAQKNLQNATALFESHLQFVFTQRGLGFNETTLGEVVEFVGGSQPPKSVFSKTKKADNIRLIQIRDYKSDKHIVFIPRALAKRFCNADDVMIGRYGPPLFQILRGIEGAYNVALMKAVPDEKRLSRDFLYYFLKHSAILEYVIYHSSRAAGQIGVTKETLEPYPIALPSPAEQKRIVETITHLETEIQRLAHLYEQKLASLEALKKSLLRQAFSGEL